MAPLPKNLRRALVALIVVALAVRTIGYLAGGGRYAFDERSPDGRERLEFRTATRWQKLTHPGADMLGYVRLHLADGEIVASPLFDLSGSGPVVWAPSGVQVSTIAVYEPARRRWSVEWSPHW